MMRSFQFALAVFSLFTLSFAWPWPPSFVDGGLLAVDGLFKRQNNNNNGGTQQTTANTASQTRTATGSAAQNTGDATGTITTGPSGTGSRATATFSGNGTTEFDLRDPPGGVSMLTPAPASGSQFYKVGDWVTFAWNYTSLQASPTAINVVASCVKNDHKYTIAGNLSAQETQVLWDTKKQQDGDSPLLTEKYTLYIYDAEQPFTATPRAGYLGNQQAYIFGMYTPQPYEGWSGYKCPTCSGAGANIEKLTLRFLFGTVAVTVISFTWFARGVGVF